MSITVYIDGKVFSREQVDAWERQRISAVMKIFGQQAKSEDLDVLRAKLVEIKQIIPYDQMVRRLRIGLALSSFSTGLMSALSFGKRRQCVIEMVVEGLSAKKASAGIEELMLQPTPENDAVNLSACPDHFVLRPLGDGGLEVIETTGGSPFPMQFFIDYDDEHGLSIPRDTSYPFQSVGIARLKNGTAVGGVRHQFRDDVGGLRARLAVDFPGLAPSYFIREHQKHLACEFSGWFRWLMTSH